MKKIKIEFKIPDEQLLDMGELREAALSELDRQNVVPDSESFSCSVTLQFDRLHYSLTGYITD